MLGIKNLINVNGRQYREDTSRKISWGHWFAFFNIIIAVFIGSRYAFLIDWPDTLFGKIYFFISLFGHFSFSVFALYLLVIFPLSFLIKNQRAFRGITVIFSTLATTLLLFDTEVFARFNFHLSSLVWNLLVNPEKGEMSRDWQIFFAPMPIILLIQMLFSRWSWEKLRSLERQKWLKKVGAVLTLSFIATHLIYAWADAYLYRPITMQRANFPLSYPMTARSFLEKHGFIVKEEYQQKLEQEGRLDALKIEYPKKTLQFETVANPPNILFISISGLRQDAVSAQTMPKLTEFANSATQFLNHYSSGNSNNAGLVGLFYGLNANYTDSILSNHTPSVFVQKLQQEHYKIGLFSATNFKESVYKQALFRGFSLAKMPLGNDSAVKNSLEFWAKNANIRPWFNYLELSLVAQNPADYRVQATRLDEQLGRLLDNAPLENTLVIITAPQGMSFEALAQKWDKKQRQNYFGQDVLQVPMIVFWKDLPVQQIRQLTSHTDLLAALMGSIFHAKNATNDYAQGSNLFDLTGNNWVQAANYHWNVIIEPDGTQYHIDRRGNYQKFDRTYKPQSSERPPFGLFLEVFNQKRSFWDK